MKPKPLKQADIALFRSNTVIGEFLYKRDVLAAVEWLKQEIRERYEEEPAIRDDIELKINETFQIK